MRTTLGVQLGILFALVLSLSSCAAASPRSMAVSPTSAAFGTQTTGTTSQMPVTVTNNGQRTIQINSASISGSTTFAVTNWAGPYTLSGGQSVTLQVSFTPTGSSSYTGTLTVGSNAGSPQVQLSGSGSSTGSGSGSTSVSVILSPSSATLATSSTQQFSAAVSGASNSSVTWSVGGIQGGNATVGTISSAGLYTAPSVLPSTPQVTVAAQSVASPSSSGSSTVSLVSTGGHDFYVSSSGSNSNSGSAAAPWQTISYAATQVSAGDTVHVLPGTYPETILISSAGGTANAHIRFISDGQWQAKVTGGGVDRAAWRINSGQYIDIIGFDVSNNHPYPSGTQGIELYDSNDGAYGNNVHDVPGSQYGGAGIHTYPQFSADDKIIGNVVHNIGDWTNPTGNQMTHGIYIESLRADIENNLVYRNQAWGIHMFHTPYNDTVTNNVVFQNGWGGVIVEGSCAEYSGGSGMNDYTTVSNNIIIYNGQNSGGNGGRGGIVEDGCTGVHNVYYNNINWMNERGGVMDNNWYLQTGTASGNFDTNPLFVNYQPDGSGDYHLQSTSVGINGGTTAGAIMGFAGAPNMDAAGGARPVGTAWDIGIYEMGSTAATWPWY